jgi:hypothetical protein
MKTLLNLAFGLSVAVAVLYAMHHWFGPFGLVYGMPVLALLGKPLVEIMTAYPRFVSRLVMRKIEGRYYEFRGLSMDIHVDERAVCWVSTADVRKLTSLPADQVLRNLVPLHCRELGDPRRWRLTAEGVSLVLAKSSDAEVAKYCHWLEMHVCRPARNRRERDLATR